MSAPSTTEAVQSCAGCGASIYPEHLHNELAQWQAGRLLCRCCIESAEAVDDGTEIQLPPMDLSQESGADVTAGAAESQPITSAPEPRAVYDGAARPIGKGARHVKTFHAKLSEGAVQNMEALVNEWLARHPEVEISFANSTVGTWEGKHPEPNLILTIFY